MTDSRRGQELSGSRSQDGKKGTLLSPKVSQTNGPKAGGGGAAYPVPPQARPLTLLLSMGKQTPSQSSWSHSVVQQEMLPFALLVSSFWTEVLMQGILSPTWQPLKQRQGHQELTSTLPYSSGPCLQTHPPQMLPAWPWPHGVLLAFLWFPQ